MATPFNAETIRRKQADNLKFALDAIKLIPTGGIVDEQEERHVFPHGQGDVYVKSIDLKRGHPISYPLEWFGANGWKRPTLTVPTVTARTSAIGMMEKMLKMIEATEQVPSETIKCFFYKIMYQSTCLPRQMEESRSGMLLWSCRNNGCCQPDCRDWKRVR